MIKPNNRNPRRSRKRRLPEWLQPKASHRSEKWTSHFERVLGTGLQLPPVDQVAAGDLKELLMKLVHTLADLRVYLIHTDHLNDRELYQQLTQHALHDQIRDVEPAGDMAYVIGLIGDKPEHLDTYLQFYASDEERAELLKRAPEILPPRRDPPHDRDRHLPRPDVNMTPG